MKSKQGNNSVFSQVLFTGRKKTRGGRSLEVDGRFAPIELTEFDFSPERSGAFLHGEQEIALGGIATGNGVRDANLFQYLFERLPHARLEVVPENQVLTALDSNENGTERWRLEGQARITIRGAVLIPFVLQIEIAEHTLRMQLAEPLQLTLGDLGLGFPDFLISKGVLDTLTIYWSLTQWKTPSTETDDVLIIGGGIAGFAAAQTLAEAGRRVRLLEKSAAFGGKASSFTDEESGHTVEHGIHGIFPSYLNLKSLWERAGIPDSIYSRTETVGLVAGGQLRTARVRGSWPSPFFLLQIVPRGLRRIRDLFFSLPFLARLSAASAVQDESLDSETYRSVLRRYGVTENLKQNLLIPYVRNLSYAEGEEVSAFAAVHALNYYLLNRPENVDAAWLRAGPGDLIFRPWARYLTALGVDLRPGVAVSTLQLTDGRVSAAVCGHIFSEVDFGETERGWVEPLPGDDPVFLHWKPASGNGPADLRALSARCTHLDCTVKAQGETGLERLYCPCHGGVFDIEGKVLQGPPTEALPGVPVRRVQTPQANYWVVGDGASDPGSDAPAAAESVFSAGHFILAVDIQAARKILPGSIRKGTTLRHLGRLDTTSVIVLRLWFQDISAFAGAPDSGVFAAKDALDNFFILNRFQDEFRDLKEAVVECHISDGRAYEDNFSDADILADALDVLQHYLPHVKPEQLDRERSVVLRHHNTFTLFAPGDLERLPEVSADDRPNLHLAGDWIRSRWPSWFMERAAVTGIQAAGVVLAERAGKQQPEILAPPPAQWTYRVLGLPFVIGASLRAMTRSLFGADR